VNQLGDQLLSACHWNLWRSRSKRHPQQAYQGQYKDQYPQGLMPNKVTSRGWVDAVVHQSAKVFWTKNEDDGYDKGCEPMKDAAKGVIQGCEFVIHKVQQEQNHIVQRHF
jgi:hypothetical protein